MAKYNGWEDPDWRHYWGVDDEDDFVQLYDPEPEYEAPAADEVLGWEE